jgi:nucleotide-binding universal stress UspA family protein
MAFKTILVPVERHDQIGSVFDCAVTFANLWGSYLEAVPARSLATDIYIAGAFGGVPVPQIPVSGANGPELRQIADTHAKRLSLARDGLNGSGSRFGWRDVEPMDDIALAARARCFDLTVFGRVQRDGAGPRMGVLETTLFESGKPILIAPPRAIGQFGKRVFIAWNGSTETARTIAFAMPILEKASEVLVLAVEGAGVLGPTAGEIAATLAANGVPADQKVVPASSRSTGEAFLAEAKAWGADLMIKGAYTQSRLRQMIFGGATNHILLSAELPVFMAH